MLIWVFLSIEYVLITTASEFLMIIIEANTQAHVYTLSTYTQSVSENVAVLIICVHHFMGQNVRKATIHPVYPYSIHEWNFNFCLSFLLCVIIYIVAQRSCLQISRCVFFLLLFQISNSFNEIYYSFCIDVIFIFHFYFIYCFEACVCVFFWRLFTFFSHFYTH